MHHQCNTFSWSLRQLVDASPWPLVSRQALKPWILQIWIQSRCFCRSNARTLSTYIILASRVISFSSFGLLFWSSCLGACIRKFPRHTIVSSSAPPHPHSFGTQTTETFSVLMLIVKTASFASVLIQKINNYCDHSNLTSQHDVPWKERLWPLRYICAAISV